METVRIIKAENAADRAFTYRATETIGGSTSYGIELEYNENGCTFRISLPNVTADKEEILKMVHTFADGCVFPNVFEETAWDYIKTRTLDRTFA